MGISVTLFSCMMAVFWSSLLLLVFILCCRWRWFLRHFGVTGLTALQWLCVARLLLFFELPGSAPVSLPVLLNPMTEALTVRGEQHTGPTQLAVFLLGVWAGAGFFLLVKDLVRFWRFYAQIKSFPEVEDPRVYETWCDIAGPGARNIRIAAGYPLTTPFVTGVFHPVIVLPRIPWEPRQLSAVLEHEYVHIRRWHILLRITLRLVCIAVWWNPLWRIWYREVLALMELRCDQLLMRGKSPADILEYCDVLLLFSRRHSEKPYGAGLAFARSSTAPRRFYFILGTVESKIKPTFLGTAILLASIFLAAAATYAVVFQPYYPQAGDWTDVTGNAITAVVDIEGRRYEVDWETLLALKEAA